MKPRYLLKSFFLVAGMLVVASVAVTYWIGFIAVQAEQSMARQLEALKQLSVVGSTLKDTETGQRGYLLTGEEAYLEPYTNALTQLREQLDGLHHLAAAGDLPSDKVEQIDALSKLKLDELGQTIQLRREQGLPAALVIVRSDRGKQLMDQIRSDLRDLQAQAQADYDEASRRTALTQMVRTVVFAIVGVLNLAFLGWAYRKISFEIQQREAAALETSRQKELLATTLASIGDGVIATDQQGRCTLMNGEAAQITGWQAADAVGRSLPEIFPIINEHTRQPVENPVERVVRTGKVVGLANHTILVARDGREKPIDDNAAPIRHSDGSLSGVVLVFRDVTEQRRSQEANARLAAIVENSGDAIFTQNLNGIIQTWNAGAERLFAYKADEIIGKPETTLFPPDCLREENNTVELLKQGQRCEIFETVRVAKNGQRVQVSIVISPLKDEDGQVVGVSKIARDISERKQAEAKLQAQLNRLALLSQTTRAIGERQDIESIFQVVVHSVEDHLPVDFGCICLYDPVRNDLTVACVGANSQALALDLALPARAQIPIDQNGLSRAIRGQLVYEPDIREVNFPFPQRLAQGGLRSMVIAPLLVESSVFGVLVAGRREARSFSSTDCEFLRQLSEHVALAAHQAQLNNALQQAYDDLRRTQQAVMQQERLRALGQMASGIAHDINNAISPVAIYTESLLEKEPSLSPRARNVLETIQRAINDVAATVARMREFYREREPQLTLRPVDLNQLAQQVADLTRARWSDMPQQRGIVINLRFDLATSLPPVMGVESEIREALTNLVFNAVDAMPDGGTLTLRSRTVSEPSEGGQPSQPARAQIEVADTGVGMDEETRRRCVEPFFTTKGERGTGLGLAMVFGMVQRHSAEIEIESVVGQGTAVRLSFSVPAKIGDPLPPPAASATVPSPLRILIVDDDPLLLKSLRDVLEIDGHQVVAVNGGQEGINTFRAALNTEQVFAAVITDLGMPHVDGRQVAQAIKAASPATPVILLTGWGQRIVAEGDMPAHVNRVLGKPPKLRELREALAQCCQSAPI